MKKKKVESAIFASNSVGFASEHSFAQKFLGRMQKTLWINAQILGRTKSFASDLKFLQHTANVFLSENNSFAHECKSFSGECKSLVSENNSFAN